jgi:filamentous hemagglutinin family protein
MQSSSKPRTLPQAHTSLQRAVARFVLIVFAATLPGSPPAHAEVSGEQVVAGDASFARDGDVTTIHASDGAIIDYDRFSVWSNEELHFVQPHSQARVLNRVFGDATHIDGGLFANGIVYIVNPAGIFFGAGAVVDVGGLYAAAGDISNEDFLAGVDRFELSGMVENKGRIEAPSVALLGRTVANHGEISAPDGTIALVAGERVLLTRLGAHLHIEVEGDAGDAGRPAIEQTGSVDAGYGEVSFTTGDVYSLALNHEGITRGKNIEVRANSGLVQVAGTMDASDLRAGATGGDIAVTGERVALLDAELDASGDAGGGGIRVGGDLRGAGAMSNAKRTFVDEQSVLRADAIRTGDGGTVVVYADEATAFHGGISARGGAAGGDGGFAEISGAVFLWSGGDVDLRAAQGANGTLLYDPKDIELVGGTADGDDDPDVLDDRLEMASLGEVLFGEPDELASPFLIYESEIEGTTGADIVLEATNSITTSGSFTNDGGEGVDVLRIADGQSVTMRTRNDPGDETGGAAPSGIDLGGLAILTSGGGGVTLETGTGVEADNLGGSVAVGDITTSGADGAIGGIGGDVVISAGGIGSVTTGAIVTTGGAGSADIGGNGGAVSVTTVDGAIVVASVDTSGGDSTSASADPIHNGGDAGSITLGAGDADASGDSDVTVAGALTAIGGAADVGVGGAGGAVSVRSDGVPTPVVVDPPQVPEPTPSFDPVAGGGAIALSNVVTTGGASTSGDGGRGGSISIQTSDGAIAAGDLDSSGAAGGANGGSGSTITVLTRDADGGNDNDVVVGDVRAVGGAGTSEGGGLGGTLSVRTLASSLVTEAGVPDNVLQEAEGGGDITIASVDVSGGDGGTFGGSANTPFFASTVEVSAAGAGNAVQVAGAVTAVGGDGAGGNGGFGGSVSVSTEDGGVALTTVDVSGGASTSASLDPLHAGGNAGSITLAGGDADIAGDGDVNVTGDLLARGGAAVEGSGGRGGSVTVRSDGVPTPTVVDPEQSLVAGGGTIDVANVDSTGGSGGASGNGGRGGAIVLQNSDGTITAGDLESSGADGGIDGGTAGDIQVFTIDADQGNDNSVDLGNVRAVGGAGIDGFGGGGGAVQLQTFRSQRVLDPDDPENVLQDALGGGDLTIASIDARGGDGGMGGGSASISGFGFDGVAVRAVASGAASTLNLGSVLASGGDGADGNGGRGGTIILVVQNDDLVVDFDVDSSGGNGTNATDDAIGGSGGSILIQTGFTEDDSASDVVIQLHPDVRRGDSGSQAFATPSSGVLSVISSGSVIFDAGPVELWSNTFVTAAEGLELNGTLDTHDLADGEVSLIADVGGSSRFAADIGANRALATLSVSNTEDAVDPTLLFEGSSVTTTGSQSYDPDATVVGDVAFSGGGSVSFFGDLDAAPAAASSDVTVDAGASAVFGGDVGGGEALTGFDVDAPQISFAGTGGQVVVTDGASGIRLNADLAPAGPASLATIGADGDLRLESTTGDLIFGDGQKLSAAGQLDLIGETVRFTDLSAVDIAVQATTAELFARDLGPVLLPNGAIATDGGTDIVANTVSFSTAPTIVGAGAAPRIATLSGVATNTGGLQVTSLPAPLTPNQISTPLGVLDLAIPNPDPGLETPELLGGSVEVPAGLYASEDAAGAAAPVSAAEVVAWLSCAPVAGKLPESCSPPPEPPYGSALDTERASEVASAWRWLLGDSPRAEAGRAALARTARDPGAPVGGERTSPAGRAYLVDAARLLARTRMLGLDAATYGELRDDLLAGLVAAIGAPELDAARLLAAIEASAMGMTI